MIEVGVTITWDEDVTAVAGMKTELAPALSQFDPATWSAPRGTVNDPPGRIATDFTNKFVTAATDAWIVPKTAVVKLCAAFAASTITPKKSETALSTND